MQIAIMSDTHDHIWNLREAISMLTAHGAEMIIHCGDFVAPFMLKELELASIPVHGVFGNNDGDQFQLTRSSLTELDNITLHGFMGEIQIKDFTIGFTHYRKVAEGLAGSGKYDVVCFGHSHTYDQSRHASCTLLNPGEILGKEGEPGFCLLNTTSGEITRRTLG